MRLIKTRKTKKYNRLIYIAKLIKTTVEIDEEDISSDLITEFEKHNFVAVKLCQLMQKRGVLKNSTIAGAIKKRDGFIFILNPKITKL